MISLLDLKREHLRPMTEEESKLFASVFFNIKGDTMTGSEFLKKAEAMEAPQALMIIAKRLASFTTEERFDPAAVIFVASLCGKAGDCALWAHALIDGAKRFGGELTLEDFSTRMFPIGIPSDEGMSAAWDSQKDSSMPNSNVLDSRSSY